MVGKLREVAVREVWRHEAHDFTAWLEENIEVINEVLGLNIATANREQAAGSFSVDLLCEDTNGDFVVIENQLERSNHDHLGKLITYLTSFDAKTAIWIVTDPRPEHVKAIIWLNESSSASFYLLKLTAVQIGESEPAPLFTLIAGPSEEARHVAVAKKELSGRASERQEFWSELLLHLNDKSKLFSGLTAGSGRAYLGTGSGLPSGLRLNFALTEHNSRAELYIDDRSDFSGDRNNEIFELFFSNRQVIEKVLGGPANWERLDSRRACRISVSIEGGWKDKEHWQNIQSGLINNMIALEKSIKPFLKEV